MHRLGVPAEREEFLTAVEATVYYLKKTRSPGDIYYAVGTASFCRQLRAAGFDIRETPDEDVTAVLVGFDTELTYQKVENACRLLARGADFLATNPDWACPTLLGSSRIAGPSASSSPGEPDAVRSSSASRTRP